MLLSQTYLAGELEPWGSLKLSLPVVPIAEVYKAESSTAVCLCLKSEIFFIMGFFVLILICNELLHQGIIYLEAGLFWCSLKFRT